MQGGCVAEHAMAGLAKAFIYASVAGLRHSLFPVSSPPPSPSVCLSLVRQTHFGGLWYLAERKMSEKYRFSSKLSSNNYHHRPVNPLTVMTNLHHIHKNMSMSIKTEFLFFLFILFTYLSISFIIDGMTSAIKCNNFKVYGSDSFTEIHIQVFTNTYTCIRIDRWFSLCVSVTFCRSIFLTCKITNYWKHREKVGLPKLI